MKERSEKEMEDAWKTMAPSGLMHTLSVSVSVSLCLCVCFSVYISLSACV